MSAKEIEYWGQALDKFTAIELRELAKGIEGVSGVHAMKKHELIDLLRKSKGIEVGRKKKAVETVQAVKKRIQALKAQRAAALEAKDRAQATLLRRKIARLKKQTRKAA
jgi:protein-arginine kinase activator protein McsA